MLPYGLCVVHDCLHEGFGHFGEVRFAALEAVPHCAQVQLPQDFFEARDDLSCRKSYGNTDIDVRLAEVGHHVYFYSPFDYSGVYGDVVDDISHLRPVEFFLGDSLRVDQDLGLRFGVCAFHGAEFPDSSEKDDDFHDGVLSDVVADAPVGGFSFRGHMDSDLALLADFAGVAARRFGDDARACIVRIAVFDEPFCAVGAARLFVGDYVEAESASQGNLLPREEAHGKEGGAEPALHVRGASAPDGRRSDFSSVRIEVPPRAIARGDDVAVAVEEQCGAFSDFCDDVWVCGRRADDAAFDAVLREESGYECDDFIDVSRRVFARYPDEVGTEADEFIFSRIDDVPERALCGGQIHIFSPLLYFLYFLGPPAGRVSFRADGFGRRIFAEALVYAVFAARGESAAGLGLDRGADFAAEDCRGIATRRFDFRDRRDERAAVGMVLVSEQFFCRRFFDYLAEVHDDDLVGDVFDHRHVVGDEHVGEIELVLKVLHQVENLRLNRDVEGRDGFVAHNEFGFQGERPGDADALASASVEFVRVGRVEAILEFDHLHQFLDALCEFFLAGDPPVDDERLRDYAGDGHSRVEGGVGVLEDDLHLFADHPEPVLVQ